MNEEHENSEHENSAVAVAELPESLPGDSSDVAELIEPTAESIGAEEPPIEAEGDSAPLAAPAASSKHWYVVKVQSGREETIKNAILRKVKIDALEEHVGRVLIPTEKVTELRNGKRVVKKRKKFPGYLMCEVEFNDKILYLFRETSGVGDFVGGSMHKPPTPMGEREVERMLLEEDDVNEKQEGGGEKEPTKKKFIIPYGVGDRVKVRDGTFKDMEGEVKEINDPSDSKENPKVKVVLSIWGRPVDVDVEYWQVDPV